MTSLLLKSNTLTATMAALCWLCSHSLSLMLLWALVLVPYALVMLWWVICCERFEEQAVPSQRYQLIGARESPRALQPPRDP